MSRSAILFPAFPSPPTAMKITNTWTPLKTLTDLLALGVFQRNVYAGGGQDAPLSAEATGSIDLLPYLPIGVDNRNTSQVSTFLNTNGGTLVCQFRFMVRVSGAAINVTPRIFNITTAAAATISGASACAATNSDYTGTNQQQTITLTIPSNALNYFKPQLTIAGTVAAGLRVWGTVAFDCFIET